MLFTKFTRGAFAGAVTGLLALGATPAAGAADMVADDPRACTLTVTSTEKPFVGNSLPNHHARPLADGNFEYSIDAADVPALKMRISGDKSDAPAHNLRFLLTQCAEGENGIASLNPRLSASSVPEARAAAVAVGSAVVVGALTFGALPAVTAIWQ